MIPPREAVTRFLRAADEISSKLYENYQPIMGERLKNFQTHGRFCVSFKEMYKVLLKITGQPWT